LRDRICGRFDALSAPIDNCSSRCRRLIWNDPEKWLTAGAEAIESAIWAVSRPHAITLREVITATMRVSALITDLTEKGPTI